MELNQIPSLLPVSVAPSPTNICNHNYHLLRHAGSDSSCLPSPSSTDLKIISNVSTSELLQTCQPLGFQVTGGTKPYTISIAALDSTLVTNVTMGSDHDLLTYINRVSPGDQLVGESS